MAGVKGRSGRKSLRDEEKRLRLIEMAWQIIFDSLNSPDVSQDKKIEIAEKIVLKDMPTTPLVDQSQHTYAQIYRPEPYTKDEIISSTREVIRNAT